MKETGHAKELLREIAAAFEAGRLAARFDRPLQGRPARADGSVTFTKPDVPPIQREDEWHH